MSQIKQIFESQAKFFKEEAAMTLSFRLSVLTKLEKAILTNRDQIHAALKKDLGKSSFEAYITETGFVLNELRFVKKNLKKWMKTRKVPSPQKLVFYSKSYIKPRPRGQVLIISPWNYPFQLLISPLVGALAAGNTAILKPSEHAPNTAALVEKILAEVFPSKYISVINGDVEVSKSLLELDWDMIFFTGSTQVGREIAKAAAEKLIPVVLELGGKCPAIVHADANIKIAARRIVWGKIINAGQTCVAPDYVLAHASVKSKLMKQMVKELASMLGKNVKESGAYGRIINEHHFTRLTALVKNSNIVHGGEHDVETLYMAPTIVDNLQPNHPLLQEEIFGPILPVLEYESIEDVVRFVNKNTPPLAIYQFARANQQFNLVARHTQSGAMLKNDTIMHLSNLHLPFGGVRQSGIGQYHGRYSFESFSNKQSIFKHATFFDSSMRYPPYTEKKWKLISKFM